MSHSEDIHKVLAHRRAILRARDLEIARARELSDRVAITVLESRAAICRAKELLDKLYELRRACEPLYRGSPNEPSSDTAPGPIPLQPA